ncbi:MAG: hypothetical protein HWE14_12725 [Flavobacteriia bacterium]|nr:hypothetical protein [Flavobacteriia bacterium]
MRNTLLILVSTCGMIAFGQTTLNTDSVNRELSSGGPSGPLYAPSNWTMPQTKLVYWIHGLAGNAQSWNRVQTSTEDQTGNPINGYPERKTEGLSVDYSGYENLRIFALAGFVNNNLIETWRVAVPRRDTLPVHRNFVIAHSQGGIVARAMRYQNKNNHGLYPTQFGAAVTFNSPHGGAKIINATHPTNGDVQKWINRGCDAFLAAEVQQLVESKWWVDFLITPGVVQNFSSKVCDGLDGLVMPMLIDAIRKPVAADYAVGAPNLKILKQAAAQDNMRMVAIGGVEEEPVLWRVMHSMTYTKDTSLSGQILFNDPFGLDSDDELPQTITNLISLYRSKERFWNSRTKGGYQLIYWNAKHKETIYREARQWLEGSNIWWKRFIGARTDSAYLDGYWCICLDSPQPFLVSNLNDCRGSSILPCNAIPNYQWHHTEVPNDGVVTLSSQQAYPGATKILLDKVNHMQARNSRETMRTLNDLFDGKEGHEFKLQRK